MLAAILAKAIREARRYAGLTKPELAALIGVTPRVIFYWEAGQKTPGLPLLCRIAVACDVPLLQLLHDVDRARVEIAYAEENRPQRQVAVSE